MAKAMSTAVQGAFLPPCARRAGDFHREDEPCGRERSVEAAVALGDPSVQRSLTATTDAIAQGRSGQTFVDPGETFAISTALPDKAYATTLIDGASNVADALAGAT